MRWTTCIVSLVDAVSVHESTERTKLLLCVVCCVSCVVYQCRWQQIVHVSYRLRVIIIEPSFRKLLLESSSCSSCTRAAWRQHSMRRISYICSRDSQDETCNMPGKVEPHQIVLGGILGGDHQWSTRRTDGRGLPARFIMWSFEKSCSHSPCQGNHFVGPTLFKHLLLGSFRPCFIWSEEALLDSILVDHLPMWYLCSKI